MNPVLCFITDRRRFGAAWHTTLVERVARAARDGVHLVQVREHDLDGGPLMQLVAACVDAVRGTHARVLVNDRLDVALAAGAHGVHLRGDSFAASRARLLAPKPFLLGRSVHSVADVQRCNPSDLDYLIFGTVFETGSKPGQPAAGVAALAVVASATPLPVLAVGGITPQRIPAVMAAGGSGVAGISMFDTPQGVS